MRLTRPLASATVALAICGSVFAQEPGPPRRDAVLAGIVVAADTGRPLRQAVVNLGGVDGDRRSAITDTNGRFRFVALDSGDYLVSASHPGYLSARFGERRPGANGPGSPIALLPGQRIETIKLELPRGGVITGTVADDAGESAVGSIIRALRYQMTPSGWAAQIAGSDITDDRGAYRITDLVPGDYIVTATLREQEYATVYYPGTTRASAAIPVVLGLAEERNAIDMRADAIATGEVSVTLRRPAGPLVGSAAVQLLEPGGVRGGLGNRTATLAGDGIYTFTNVAPGQYSVFARATTMWGTTSVTVEERSIAKTTVQLRHGQTVSGRISLEGTDTVQLDDVTLSIALQPIEGAASGGVSGSPLPPIVADSNGRFTIPNVIPGTYRISTVGVPVGFTVQSAMFGGRDAMDFLLDVRPGDDAIGELVIGLSAAELVGSLLNANGAGATAYTLILFPADARYWLPNSRRVQATRPSTDGRYAFREIPPGDYRVAVVFDPEDGRWHDPGHLRELLPAAVPITLGTGEKKTQDLRTGR